MNHAISNNIDFNALPDSAFIRMRALPALVGFSVPTIWRKAKLGEFPIPVKVSRGITAWRVGDVREWLKDPQAFKVPAKVKQASRDKCSEQCVRLEKWGCE